MQVNAGRLVEGGNINALMTFQPVAIVRPIKRYTNDRVNAAIYQIGLLTASEHHTLQLTFQISHQFLSAKL
jgi:hypothetical protein